MQTGPYGPFEFGCFRLDPTERRLLCDGRPISLTPKAFHTLVILVQNCGHVLGKDELIKEVWPGTFVEEGGLARNISVLRKVLGEDPSGRVFIETVPKRGYRFVAQVRRAAFSHSPGTAELSPDVDATPVEQGPTRTDRGFWWAALTIGALVATLSVLPLVWRRGASAPTAIQTAQSIAVLPFQTWGVRADQDYLGLGMADALITRLSRVDRITVRPTVAISRYTNRERDSLAAARELKVGSLLDGNIQRVGDRIRVTVQLVQVQDGRLLWGGTFEEPFLDVFSIQDRVSARVAELLLVTLRREELQRLASQDTQNGAAYEAYLKARYLLNERTPETLSKALASFTEAIDRDRRYARAYAGLADSYALLGVYGALPTTEAFPKAKAAASAALNIDETIGEAHTTLAFVKTLYDWDWAGGEAEFKRAIQLSPSYSTAHHWYAINLMSTGRVRDSIAEVERAQALDPLSPIISTDVGEMFYWAGDYERAIAQARKTLEIHPHYYLAHGLLGWAYAHKGDFRQALAEFRQVPAGMDDHGTRVGIGYVAALTNNRTEARRALEELKDLATTRYVSPHHLAVMHAALGERDQAFECLEKAYENRVAQLNWLKIDPRFRELRSDPRFTNLLRRLRLET